MSTVQEAVSKPIAIPCPRPEDESHFVLYGISWEFYEKMLAELGNRASLRITYDQGSLELMTISQLHERYKSLLDRFIFAVAIVLDLTFRRGGSATFKRADMQRGFEPDECYWFHNEPLIRDLVEVDLTRDPPFELAVEVEISTNILDRLPLFAAMGVVEVWRFNGETLRVYRLRADRTYEEVPESQLIPGLPSEEVVGLVHQGLTMSDPAFFRTVQTWARQCLLPGWQASTPSP